MRTAPARESVVVSVDISSSGLRCLAHHRDLSIAEGFSVPVATRTLSDGTSTHSWPEVADALDDGLAYLARRFDNIEAISMSGTASSLAVAGIRTDPTEILLWSDHRAAAFQEGIADYAEATGSYDRTLCPSSVSYWPAKLQWSMSAADADERRSLYFAGSKDLAFNRLTGHKWTDPMTAAATGLFDSAQFQWDAPLLAFTGVDPSQLPAVRPATARAAVLPAVADRLGLPHGTTVALGGMDGPLAQLGAAAFEPKIASCTVGTTLAFRMGSPQRVIDRHQRTWCYPVLDDYWVSGGAGSNGGNVLTWLAAVTGRTDDLANLLDTALNLESDPQVLFLPYLNGERAPLWSNSLRASITGLASHHSAVDIARAALDGVAAAAIELAAAVTDATGSPDEVRLTGGFLGNNAWAQLMTDALGLPTSIPQPEAATSTGAAMIGWLASDPARGITPPGAADQRRPRPVAHQLLAAKSLRARRFREWQMTDHDE